MPTARPLAGGEPGEGITDQSARAVGPLSERRASRANGAGGGQGEGQGRTRRISSAGGRTVEAGASGVSLGGRPRRLLGRHRRGGLVTAATLHRARPTTATRAAARTTSVVRTRLRTSARAVPAAAECAAPPAAPPDQREPVARWAACRGTAPASTLAVALRRRPGVRTGHDAHPALVRALASANCRGRYSAADPRHVGPPGGRRTPGGPTGRPRSATSSPVAGRRAGRLHARHPA